MLADDEIPLVDAKREPEVFNVLGSIVGTVGRQVDAVGDETVTAALDRREAHRPTLRRRLVDLGGERPEVDLVDLRARQRRLGMTAAAEVEGDHVAPAH